MKPLSFGKGDSLTSKYKKLVQKSKTEGHCYAAAEALFHLSGGKESGFIPCVASFEENGEKLTHWWLKNNNEIFDPTSEQFTTVDQLPPYEKGKGSGFLTKEPSKRALEIINRVKKNKM